MLSLPVSGCSSTKKQEVIVVLIDVTCQIPRGGLEHLTVSSDVRTPRRVSLESDSSIGECNHLQGFWKTLQSISSLAERLENYLAQGDETQDLILSLLKQTQEHIPGMDS